MQMQDQNRKRLCIDGVYPAPIVIDKAGPKVANHIHHQLQGEYYGKTVVELRVPTVSKLSKQVIIEMGHVYIQRG
jgi:hypothetical protein